jgi:hypothetical protein
MNIEERLQGRLNKAREKTRRQIAYRIQVKVAESVGYVQSKKGSVKGQLI